MGNIVSSRIPTNGKKWKKILSSQRTLKYFENEKNIIFSYTIECSLVNSRINASIQFELICCYNL